ncbi:hypothetical protein RHGRI_030865 [Rhododendron griersonianum]|uniref:Reverse transcriptase domain-containing protein n=1 Tax=Rhododendron griersonianum TaxID=479676 RepID=A0AAV6I676_9ERIC|nr:hypothetical protein RHGRI_030865 [Rhododendron griersonianum]
MLRLSLKLRWLKPVLRDLNANCFSNISGRVMKARTQMENLQNLCSQNLGNESLREMEKEAVRVFMELSATEESFKKQKSRVTWLALGDQNTKLFHRKVRSNRARNKILSLVTAKGLRLDKPEEVQLEIIQFYKGLLGTKFLQRQDARASLQQIIQRKVPVHMCGELVKPVLVEEITAALQAIKGDKAPGPDGFSSSFFQQNWEIVGQDLIVAVQHFFHKGFMLKEWNSTTLTLVPKMPSLSMAKDFRPIACCNVVYIVIANRMQSVLPLVIGPTQSVFIKGRSIVDNVLLTHELIRNYHRDVGLPRCAIKIDLMKAYDSVDWNFLLDTMDAMGFPSLFIGWVKECVTTPMYSAMLNGGLVGYFPGAKGLRQGDPISPLSGIVHLSCYVC